MKHFISVITLILLTTSISFGQNKSATPNIIFILADDLGYSELGSYGNTFNETPHLDQLAEEGLRFTQAYAAAPVCSPTRAAFMTGQYPARVGITDYLRPDAGVFLDTAYVTLAEALRENGYKTGIIGKWHLSGYKLKNAPVEMLPDKHGFDEVISSEITGIANSTYFYPYHFNPEMKKKLKDEREFIVDRMNVEAIDFIERNKKKPFFLYLSHYAVHTMVHGKPDLVAHFQSKTESGHSRPSMNNPQDDPYVKWPSDYFAEKNNPHLAAQIYSIDEGVGMIRQKLEKLGLADNTIIIFTSDNGGESRVTDNAPLKGGKSTLYEGGIREPLIIYQPKKIEARVSSLPVSTYDFYPTICSLTGTELPKNQVMDGQDFSKNILGSSQSDEERLFFWHYPLEKKHFLGGRSSVAVRQGDWKLIEFYDTGERELYNLKEDVGEKNNLITENPKKVDELQSKLIEWREVVLDGDYDF